MEEHCPYCGTKLSITSWGRRFCPNCGVLDSLEENKTGEIPSYC